MNWIKALLATAAIGVIVVAFRDSANDRWLVPALPGGDSDRDAGNYVPDGEEEPVLGYDGMDQEALLDWLVDARLDRSTLARIRRYEAENLGREAVIEAVEDLL
jgi:hypothetical protein